MSPVIHIGDSILLEGTFDAKRLAYKFDLEEKANAFKLSFRENKSSQKKDIGASDDILSLQYLKAITKN